MTDRDNTPTDRPVREDTGKISGEAMAQARGVGTVEADLFLDAVAQKLAARVNGSREKRFLGLELGAWVKLGIGWAIAAVVFLLTWYNTVNRDLGDRPTVRAVDETIDAAVKSHGLDKGAHPDHLEQLELLDDKQQQIRESQIRQELIDTRQTEILEEIRDDLRRQ
jgi:hypothetical protein